MQKAEKFDKITQVNGIKLYTMGIRQAVRQRTLTPSFGCSNHLSPATKKGMPVGVPFFVAEMKREDVRVNRVFARGGKHTLFEIGTQFGLTDDALTACSQYIRPSQKDSEICLRRFHFFFLHF